MESKAGHRYTIATGGGTCIVTYLSSKLVLDHQDFFKLMHSLRENGCRSLIFTFQGVSAVENKTWKVLEVIASEVRKAGFSLNFVTTNPSFQALLVSRGLAAPPPFDRFNKTA